MIPRIYPIDIVPLAANGFTAAFYPLIPVPFDDTVTYAMNATGSHAGKCKCATRSGPENHEPDKTYGERSE